MTSLSATRDEDENLVATASNASYQDYGAGPGGANGYTESISKTPTSVICLKILLIVYALLTKMIG